MSRALSILGSIATATATVAATTAAATVVAAVVVVAVVVAVVVVAFGGGGVCGGAQKILPGTSRKIGYQQKYS